MNLTILFLGIIVNKNYYERDCKTHVRPYLNCCIFRSRLAPVMTLCAANDLPSWTAVNDILHMPCIAKLILKCPSSFRFDCFAPSDATW